MSASGLVGNASQTMLQRGVRVGDWLRHVPASRWRRVIMLGLCIWLVYSLAQLFWLVMPEPQLPSPGLTPPSNIFFTQGGNNTQSTVDIASLKSISLFGDASATPIEEPKIEAVPEIEAAPTNLRLSLVAAWVANPDNLSTAMIENGGKQTSYRIGEEIDINPRGVKVARIMKDQVILDNRGAYESLPLWKFDDPNNSSGRTSAVSANRSNARNVAPPMDFAGRGGPSDDVETETVDQLVDTLQPEEGQSAPTAQQVKAITDLVQVQQFRENGEFVGFKIRPRRDRELFDSLGLQANDVIVAVNDVRLTDMTKAMEEYRSLSKAKTATLEVLRDGYSHTITIDLENSP